MSNLIVNSTKEDYTSYIKNAEKAGFIIFNLMDIYDNHDPKSIQLAEWDLNHPNSKGHKLIADRIFEDLQEKRHLIKIGLFSQTVD